ncbi:hypothetical protein [Edaphobacter bradus]|uniref:hypothetical protein n=1 Tax=Edaphobacter bradus TaxID=2259016 RepID=UPI0021E083A0|nr:hypothetical protein [Edaphobacter bradus]
MKKLTGLFAGGCLLIGGLFCGVTGVASAQEMKGPPKVLVVAREFLKPGRAGSIHEKSESAFVRAMAEAKWPQHYFAADSMSGRSRALFFVGYDSFAAWEKDNQDTEKNATLSAALDRAALADGDLLSEYDSGVLVYREEMSLRPNVDIAQMRYFEISVFKVKAGHQKDWEDLVKMYKEGYEKAVPDAKWAVFESAYGADNGGVFVVFNPMKSLAEVDKGFADEKKFMESMGEDGMKKLSELSAKCLESEQSNLFHFNPKMSYPPEEWIKADPFWKPKVVAAAPAKATAAAAKAGQ